MEGIKSLLMYIGIHGLGLVIGFAIVAVLMTLKEHVNKINWFMRIILLPVVMLLALISVAAKHMEFTADVGNREWAWKMSSCN